MQTYIDKYKNTYGKTTLNVRKVVISRREKRDGGRVSKLCNMCLLKQKVFQ